jgi:hypothetical protein
LYGALSGGGTMVDTGFTKSAARFADVHKVNLMKPSQHGLFSADEIAVFRRVLDRVLSDLPPHLQTTANLLLIADCIRKHGRNGKLNEFELCRMALSGVSSGAD